MKLSYIYIYVCVCMYVYVYFFNINTKFGWFGLIGFFVLFEHPYLTTWKLHSALQKIEIFSMTKQSLSIDLADLKRREKH